MPPARPLPHPEGPDLADELWTNRHLARYLHCGRSTVFATVAAAGFPTALSVGRSRRRLWAAAEVRAWADAVPLGLPQTHHAVVDVRERRGVNAVTVAPPTPDPAAVGASRQPRTAEARPPALISESGRVRATPPGPSAKYWRVSIHAVTGARTGQTTGGTTQASAVRKLADLDRRLAAHAPAGAMATEGGALLDHFVDPLRPKNLAHPDHPHTWSATYTDQTNDIIDRYLRPVFDPLPLRLWAAEHAFEALDACPTNYVVAKVRRTLSAILAVGVADGFLRSDQRGLHRVTVPLRPELRPTRRVRARQPDATALLHPDEVPSIDQVRRLATARPPGMDPLSWEGTVNFMAYGGVRIGELLACSAEDVLDTLPAGLIAVRWQLIEPRGGPKRLAPPKNNIGRLVALCETTPLGFALRTWLTDRAHAAAEERARGRNPAATLITSPRDGWWTRSNFRARCFNPAATAANWERLTWQGPIRRKVCGRWTIVAAERHDWCHPLHALRHHYACTARDIWGWTGAELCLNGGWADEAFVLARYYGSTEDTYRSALAKQSSRPRVGGDPR